MAGELSSNGVGPAKRPRPISDEAIEAIERFADIDAVMARASGENFPVALAVLPRRLRNHLKAVYGYARLVDNLGDEYPGDRSVALDWLDQQIDSLYKGTPRHPVFKRLAVTVNDFDIPRSPFDQLLAANRLDQTKHSYADWDELMKYCELSATPVGRLVLAIFEVSTAPRRAASDSVCSGLQVLEHLQDLGEDAAAGRFYLPIEDMERFDCTPADLLAPVAGGPLRELVAFECGRARELLAPGRTLVASLGGFARLAIAGFVAGGLAGLDAIQQAECEVLSAKRTAGAGGLLRCFLPLYFQSA